MRNDIDLATLTKTALNLQSPVTDAEPRLSLVVARKESMLTDIDFTERRRVAKTTLNTVTDVAIAVCHPKLNHDDTAIYIAYIQNGKVYLRWSKTAVDVSDIDWESIDLETPPASKVDIAFKSTALTNTRGVTEYVTEHKPMVFYVLLGSIYCIDVATMETETLVNGYVKDLTVRQTPEGLVMFYAKTTGGIFYKMLKPSGWDEEEEMSGSFSGTIDGLSSFAPLEGFGLQIYSDGKLYRYVETPSSRYTWAEIATATGTGAIVEYYDSTEDSLRREAFYDNQGFKYGIFESDWTLGYENDLYPPQYAVIEFDHTNQGIVYFANVMHRETTDVIYFFRYVYMHDCSNIVASVEKVLQVDNPISQINATLKNVNGSLFVSDSTLFAPSSIMRLGVRYGTGDLVDLGFGYVDEVNYQYGGKTVSISGRNITGAYLSDQTFDEEMVFYDSIETIVSIIAEKFGNFWVEVDPRGTYPNYPDTSEVRRLSYTATPETTGLEALETLSELLSQESAGNNWKFEEMYDGTLVLGFDDFRAQYIPKGHYSFNGRTDVFAEQIDRCIDGVYTAVRCTGVTPKGKDISYTYPVETFRFWAPGDHRTYHAPTIEGITKDELKKYAKALAKELKYAGRVMTYKMNLKPQLLIGDVAEVTYGVEEGADPEMLGSITEITHTMGERGYFTEFTLTSGGNINNASVAQAPATRSATPTQALVYVAESGKKGTNRITRLADFLGMGNGKNTTINATTINQIINGIANFPELIRNIGFRLLDEPTNVQATYDEENNAIKLKWTDPLDISTSEPVDCEWAGTVVVRSANGEPLNRWDGTLIEESTTRNEYASDWLVDDTVEKGTVYYYAIMPYDTKGDYRYTKVVQIQAGGDIANPVITSLSVSNDKVLAEYTIPNAAYSYVKLVYKKGSIPTSYSDGTAIDILQSSTSAEIAVALDGDTYFFVIFTDKSTSEPQNIKVPLVREIVLYDSTGSTVYIDERINADSKWDIYSEYSYDYGKIKLRDGYIGQSGRNNVNNRSTTQAKFNISGYKYLCVTGENTDNLGPTAGRCFVVFSQNKPTDYSELYTLPHTENQYSPINTVSTKKVDISNLGFTEGYITIFGAITRYKVYKLWFEKEVI